MDQRASLSVLNLAVDTEAKPAMKERAIMTTALTHGAIMTRVSAKVQLSARLIGGGGDS